MGTSYNSSIVTDGLVLCLDAANPRSYPGSGTSWLDLSGNNRTGTLTNGPTFISNNGGIIDFDGTNDYIEINNARYSIDSLNISVEMWVYQDVLHTDSTFSNIINLFEIPSSAVIGSESCFWLHLRSGNVSFRYQKAASQAQVSPEVEQEINVWHHYVGTSDDDYISLYRDGQLIGSNSNSYTFSALSTITPHARLGETGYYNKHFNGKMSGVKMYNRALSADEVRRNYNATRGRYGN